jgi:hypothetical protein
MEEIKDVLVKMYPWARLEQNEMDLKKMILIDLKKISKYSIQEIRSGVKSFIDECINSKEGYNTDQMSKLYVLNRYLFNLPEYVDINEPRFAAIRGIPVKNDKINLLWPLEKIGKNELQITGIFKGYSGESFLALKEFDFFNEKYGVKKVNI